MVSRRGVEAAFRADLRHVALCPCVHGARVVAESAIGQRLSGGGVDPVTIGSQAPVRQPAAQSLSSDGLEGPICELHFCKGCPMIWMPQRLVAETFSLNLPARETNVDPDEYFPLDTI